MKATLGLSLSYLERLDHESWINQETAEAWGLSRVTSSEGAALVGRNDLADYSGIAIHTYWPGESAPRETFLRRDHPDYEMGNGGTPKPKQKYLAPPGRGNRLIMGPDEPAEALTDPSISVLILEGLKKIMAGWRLARLNTESPRFLACGVTGVWNWRGTIAKTTDASGARVSIKGVIPDFDRINWDGRRVFIVYDSDALTNTAVAAAREALSDELRNRGAQVVVMYLPALDGLEKTGFDDLCARWRPQAVLDWLATADTGAAEVQDDQEPSPLDSYHIPAFPIDLMPVPWLRDMIAATAASTETPVELPMMAGLGMVAICIQRKFSIAIDADHWEPTCLWVVSAAESGMRKTQVQQKMWAPLRRFEREHNQSNEAMRLEADATRRLMEERIKELRRQASRAEGAKYQELREQLLAEESIVPLVPKEMRLWVQDVTIEKLGQLMADHGEVMALISDEGGPFDTMAGRYSHGIVNIDLLLDSYSGATHRIDRGSRPAVYLERPHVTLVISPQPLVLRKLTFTPEFRGCGLLARCLYTLSESTLGYRKLVSHPIPHNVITAYDDGIHRLLLLPPRPDSTPRVIRFSAAAFDAWKAFQRHVEDEMRPDHAFAHIRDWAAKLPGNVARIIAALHCAEHAHGIPDAVDVSLETVEAALAFGGVFERHALAAFNLMAADGRRDGAQKILAWIERKKKESVTRRECFRGVESDVAFPEVESIDPALRVLVDRGYLIPERSQPHKPGRPPSPSFRVNRHIVARWQ